MEKGNNVPLTHQDWIKAHTHNLNNPNLHSGIVADLIHQDTNTWNIDLVRAISPYPQCAAMESPLPKTNSVCDKLLWKHLNKGDFNVKTTYKLLLEDFLSSSNNQPRQPHIKNGAWNLIWKIKTPLKIFNFV